MQRQAQMKKAAAEKEMNMRRQAAEAARKATQGASDKKTEDNKEE